MRRLLLVPIIHSQTDMGSTGPALAERSAALLGEQRWRLHQETMEQFWRSLRAYLLTLDTHRLRVYQDGLPVGDEAGRHIVKQAAERGSHNYRLVLELLDAGAQLQSTEDPALLLEEHRNVRGLMGRGMNGENRGTRVRQARRDSLTESRDRSIAQAISSTLKEGEIGVLFIGAYHSVESHMTKDISVEAVKEPQRVRAYFRELFLGHDEHRLAELASDLASPVTPAQHGPDTGSLQSC